MTVRLLRHRLLRVVSSGLDDRWGTLRAIDADGTELRVRQPWPGSFHTGAWQWDVHRGHSVVGAVVATAVRAELRDVFADELQRAMPLVPVRDGVTLLDFPQCIANRAGRAIAAAAPPASGRRRSADGTAVNVSGLSSALPSIGGEATASYLQRLAALRQSQQQERLDDPLQQAVALAGLQGQDQATISSAAREAAAREAAARDHDHDASGDERHRGGEREMLDELSARDREVRAHEAAHHAAAGDLAIGGPSYTYQTGPDGKRYAIGGEVTIRLSEGRTPEETLRNMERAMQAANAPDSPSGPDRVVASQAARLAAKARRELAEEQAAEAQALRDDATDGNDDDGPRPTRSRVDVVA